MVTLGYLNIKIVVKTNIIQKKVRQVYSVVILFKYFRPFDQVMYLLVELLIILLIQWVTIASSSKGVFGFEAIDQ